MLFKTKQLPLLLFALLLVSAASKASATQDPESQERLSVCLRQCDRYVHSVKVESCIKLCHKKYAEEESEGGQGGGEEEKQKGDEEDNPYVFKDQHFSTYFKTQHGHVRMLQKFTDRSKLLRGLENYRITILEAEPQTFFVPSHWDTEYICFVVNGRGSMSLIRPEKRESFNIKRGDILRIPAGTPLYFINSDKNEKFILANLLQPVSTPENFEAIFSADGEEIFDSFYRVFSNNILEAAFMTKIQELKSLFGQQNKGLFIKASEEQLKALSRHEEGGIWPFGGESKGPINLFQKRPSEQNKYGRLYEANPEDHRQLEDLNIAVSYLNLTQGAMTGLMYNSKATKITIVLNGEGYFEMACPHLSSQSSGQGKGGIKYKKVSTPPRRGTVVVIPAGHPFVTVASNNQNLEVICFEVNARNNQKVPLVGKNSVVSQFEREAKELAFNAPSRKVDKVFGSQEGEYFLKGPKEQHQGRAEA